MKKIIIAFIACIPIATLKPMDDEGANALKKIKPMHQVQTKNNTSSSQVRSHEFFVATRIAMISKGLKNKYESSIFFNYFFFCHHYSRTR